MIEIHQFVGLAFAALSIVAIGFTLGAAATIGLGSRSAPSRRGGPPVTLLKPLHLAEPGLEENLKSFFRQDYDGEIQIIFGARSHNDPALGIVERLRRAFPGIDVEVVVGAAFGASNPKVANLANMVARVKHDVVIMSDSDIRVRTDYVREVMAALEEPGVGAVSCLYSGRPIGGVWSKLAAMGIDYHFVPNARFGITLGLTKPCFGSTIAFRRRTLEEIGGFQSLSNVLADDFELGRAIRAKGHALVIPASLKVEHVCSQQSALSLLQQELRWAKTNLMVARSCYVGTLLTYPVPLALFAVLFQETSPVSLLLVAASLASRVFLIWRSGCPPGRYWENIWLLPIRDVLAFAIYVASFFGKTVFWRGTRYLAEPDGALAQLQGQQ